MYIFRYKRLYKISSVEFNLNLNAKGGNAIKNYNFYFIKNT